MVNKKIRGVMHAALDECLDALLHYEQLSFVKGEVIMKIACKDDKLYFRMSTHFKDALTPEQASEIRAFRPPSM
ncbi:hypothetical protein AAVH_41958, partial [Aphelenchoides avenae]